MPDLCEAHLERTGQQVEAFRIGLCRDCYYGRDIRPVRKAAEPEAPSPDCSRCGAPRHRGGCKGASRKAVDPLNVEHATALLIEGKSVAYVMSVAGVPRRVVEEIQASLEITENNS